MEWLKTLLKSLGFELTDEALEQIKAESAKHMVAKQDYDAAVGELNGIKDQLKERNTDLESLIKTAGLSEDLQTQLSALQTKYDTDTQNLNSALQKQRFDSELEMSLIKAQAKNSKAVRALLDADKLQLNDKGEIEGLEDQLKTLRETADYLFDNTGGLKGADPKEGVKTDPAPATLGDAVAQALSGK